MPTIIELLFSFGLGSLHVSDDDKGMRVLTIFFFVTPCNYFSLPSPFTIMSIHPSPIPQDAVQIKDSRRSVGY